MDTWADAVEAARTDLTLDRFVLVLVSAALLPTALMDNPDYQGLVPPAAFLHRIASHCIAS